MPADRQCAFYFGDTWPEMQLHILDFFEDQTLAIFKSQPPSVNATGDPTDFKKGVINASTLTKGLEMFQKAEKAFGRMSTLQIQLTSLGVKVLKDTEVVVDLPAISEAVPGAQPGVAILEELEECSDSLFGTEKNSDPLEGLPAIVAVRTVRDGLDIVLMLFLRLIGFCYYLFKHRNTLKLAQLQQMWPILIKLIEMLSTIWKRTIPETELSKEECPLSRLGRDLNAWIEGVAEYPEDFNTQNVGRLMNEIISKLPDYGSENSYSGRISISNWHVDLTDLVDSVLRTKSLHVVDVQKEIYRHFTKDFTVIDSPCNNTEYFRTEDDNPIIREAFSQHEISSFEAVKDLGVAFVVPDRNLIIRIQKEITDNGNCRHWWKFIDLEKLEALQKAGGKQPAFVEITQSFDADNIGESHSCFTGIFICDLSKKLMEFYAYDEVFKTVPEESHKRIPIPLDSKDDARQTFRDLSILETKSRKRFFLIAEIKKTTALIGTPEHLEANTYTYFSFVSMKLSADNSQMKVISGCHHRFSSQIHNPAQLLMEGKKGRIFACIRFDQSESSSQSESTPHDGLATFIFVLMYQRGQFVPFGSSKKQNPGIFRINFGKIGILEWVRLGMPRITWKDMKSDSEREIRKGLIFGTDYRNLVLVDPPEISKEGVLTMAIKHLKFKY